MINWNQNDTKYIIKRILLYLIIGGIVFCFGSRCAKAQVQSYQIWSGGAQQIPIGSYYKDVDYHYSTILNDRPQGYVIFTIGTWSTGQVHYNVPISAVELFTINASYTCDIGNMYTYSDNQTMQTVYSVKCPYYSIGTKLMNIRVKRYSDTAIQEFIFSQYITFVSEESDANSIISGQQQAIQSQISNDNTNTQNIMDAIAQQTTRSVDAINNQTSAINDNTQAIEDINDTINADLNPQIPTDFLDGLDGLFVTGDSNIIRGILMLPLDIFVIIYNAVTSNTCTTYSFGSLYNVNLSLPCINWQNIVGNGLYIIIDTIMGSALLFGLIRYAKKVLNNAFTVAGRSTDVVEVFK